MPPKNKQTMAQARKRSRTPRPAEIDPALVDIRSKKPKRGRPITLTAKIKNYEKAIIGECKLSLSKDTAALIQADLLWHAQNVAAFHQPNLIQDSLLGELITRTIGPPESTSYRYTLACIRESIEGFGPWIEGFVTRVSGTKPPTKDDALLLKKILAKAQKSGYKKSLFYRPNCPDRILKSTLRGFLIEYCLGGPEWWSKNHLLPPFMLSLRSIERQRGKAKGDQVSPLNIFRHYLGPDYKTKIKDPKKPIIVPPRIRGLQKSSRIRSLQ